MSRSKVQVTTSAVKAPTNSGKVSKPAPTQWKDRLAAQDYEELKNTFDVFDEDGSGSIDPIEINKVLEELGLDKRNPFVLGLINGLKEKNNHINHKTSSNEGFTFDEFYTIVSKFNNK